ncbi:hypothetical protein GIB67_017497 [Kingdonia uniflora]|uniref:Pentatricopeptide repeat-containing protein n=1 Tax=Kingdonia uniflora TaxID=39325 RepID=A0A7J7M4R3_9MAGN|nr:hypothetical protein GIB67_017497 [Kingdonia uniflora]
MASGRSDKGSSVALGSSWLDLGLDLVTIAENDRRLLSCIRVASLVCGTQVHGRILRDGHLSDCLLLTTLMDSYAICGSGNEGARVFFEMPDRDTVAWNVLILCYVRNGRTRNAFSLFDVMQRPENGVHDYVEEHGYGKSVKICNSLITMYARCGCVDKATRVFHGYLGVSRYAPEDVVAWTALITGLAINGQGRDAIEAFTEMQRMGVHPDV